MNSVYIGKKKKRIKPDYAKWMLGTKAK